MNLECLFKWKAEDDVQVFYSEENRALVLKHLGVLQVHFVTLPGHSFEFELAPFP